MPQTFRILLLLPIVVQVNCQLPSDVWYFTASQLIESWRIGAFTVTEYTEALIERMVAYEILDAYITPVPYADLLSAARQADLTISQGGGGEFVGVPFVCKDNYNSVDMPTTAGTPALDGFIPSFVAPALDVLLQANSILTGKANMMELAKGLTSENLYYGFVKNPYNLTRVAGGSSGGTGAALGARLSVIGLGSDTQGSGRIPAAFCGISGFRPSMGRYDIRGVMPLRATFDSVSPMATSVEDIQLMDDVLCRTTSTCENDPEPPTSLAGLRVGISRFHFFDNLEPDVALIIERSLDILRTAGAELVQVDIPREIPDLYPEFPDPMATYELPREVSFYLADSGSQTSYIELTEKIADPEIKEFFYDALDPERTLSFDEFNEVLQTKQGTFQKLMESYFYENNLDVMVYPTCPVEAIPIGSSADAKARAGQNISFNSVARFNALSVPGAALTSSGMPVGLEFTAPTGRDKITLAIGRMYDELRPRLPLPDFPEKENV